MHRKLFLIAGIIQLLWSVPLLACIWDRDTLKEEQRGLPSIADLLAGKWGKHSSDFYKRRIMNSTAAIAKDRGNLAAWDDLAVAHEKLGDHEKAIEVMLEKEKVKPGEYTTAANIGTFYAHKGDFENAAIWIRKAIEINPDAHFGREKYQLKAIEFRLAVRENPELAKTRNFLGVNFEEKLGADFRTLAYTEKFLELLGLEYDVFDGITGMIRFGTGKSPELYFVLGELLAARGDKGLAYRAYQRALDLEHPRSAEIRGYMKEVQGSVQDKQEFEAEKIAAERAAAEEWVRKYQEREDTVKRSGKSPS